MNKQTDMKIVSTQTFSHLLLLVLTFMAGFVVKAENPQYLCDIRNEHFTASNVFEFDLYLSSTGSNPFELACFQTGLKLNSAFLNGGSITPSVVSGSSELNSEQNPVSISFVAGSDNCIRIAPRKPPRIYNPPNVTTNGSTIGTGSGSRVCTVRLTNTQDFAMEPATYTWNFTTHPYNTIVAAFIPGSPAVSTIITQQNSYTISDKVDLVLQGLYTGPLMRKAQDESGDHFQGYVADQITVKLAQENAPYTIVREFNNVNLLRNGKCAVAVPASLTGNYYIVISHRNSIETWSANPVSFAASPVEYDFTSAYSQAYGDNLAPMNGIYAIFTGDVDGDGIVGIYDMGAVENASNVFAAGYLPEDVNGDGAVGIYDMGFIENNSNIFVSVSKP
jgi:hypothetical protein